MTLMNLSQHTEDLSTVSAINSVQLIKTFTKIGRYKCCGQECEALVV